jgi:hypothetical protein
VENGTYPHSANRAGYANPAYLLQADNISRGLLAFCCAVDSQNPIIL